MTDFSNNTWKVEDIFQDIEDDPDNILMTIPEEVAECLNLRPGDDVVVSVTDGRILLSRRC